MSDCAFSSNAVQRERLLASLQEFALKTWVHLQRAATYGNIERQRSIGLAKRDTLPRFCRECDVRFACHGGCPKDRFIDTPDGEPGLNYLCAGYKAFFHHVDRPMRLMSDLLRRGLPPSAVMGWYAREDDRIADAVSRAGRNDPCPCGSGRMVKQCHGAAA